MTIKLYPNSFPYQYNFGIFGIPYKCFNIKLSRYNELISTPSLFSNFIATYSDVNLSTPFQKFE